MASNKKRLHVSSFLIGSIYITREISTYSRIAPLLTVFFQLNTVYCYLYIHAIVYNISYILSFTAYHHRDNNTDSIHTAVVAASYLR